MRNHKNMILWEEQSDSKGIQAEEYRREGWIQMALSVGIVLLFLWSSVEILKSLFPMLYLEAKYVRLMVILVVGMVGWNKWMERKGALLMCQMGNGIGIAVAALGFYLYYNGHRLDIEDGILSILGSYVDLWNAYYQMNLQVSPGVALHIPAAFGFLMLIAAVAVVMLACLWRRLWLVGLLPVLAIVLHLLVGYAPQWNGLALLWAAFIFCFSGTWKRAKGLLPALELAVLVLVVLGLTSFAGTQPAEAIAAKEEEMLVFQKNLEIAIQNIQLPGKNIQNGAVDNRSLHYQGEEVIEVSMSSKPWGNVYLRGYYGSAYRGGSWRADDADFEAACREHGTTPEEAAKMLSALVYQGKQLIHPVNRTNPRLRYTIDYTNIRDSYVYMPYYIDPDTSEEELTWSGDYDVRKKRSLTSVSITGMESNLWYAEQTPDLEGDEAEFANWYNQYVSEHYLDVPESQTAAKAIVQELLYAEGVEDTLRDSWVSGLEDSNLDVRNNARIALSSVVQMELQRIADYSQELEEISSNVDPVEYFLGTSHTGYCVHFASAGVFMLREMGIPARYCTGYIAKASDLVTEGQGENAQYVNHVKDQDAHAWAEVYLDNFGWVPVEMTPGYSYDTSAEAGETESDAVTDFQGVESESESAADSEDPESQTSEEPESQEADTTSENSEEMNSEEGNLQSGQEASDDGTNTDETDANWGFAGEGGLGIFGQNGRIHVGNLIKWILVLVGIIGAVAAAIYWVKSQSQSRRERLAKLIGKGRYQAVINELNRLMYRKTVKLLRRRIGGISDPEYQEILEKTYPKVTPEQWEQYMAVVKKAAFSKDEFSMEEMILVYEIYKQCRNVTEI